MTAGSYQIKDGLAATQYFATQSGSGTAGSPFVPQNASTIYDSTGTYAVAVDSTGNLSVKFAVGQAITLGAGTARIGIITTDQTTHGLTDLVAADITKIGGVVLSLGSKASAGSLPVVLASDQAALNTIPQVAGAAISPTNAMPVIDGYTAPVAATWTAATAINQAATVPTSGYDTVILTFVPSGTITAGALVFEVFDGATWLPIKAARIESYATDAGYTLSGPTRAWQIPVAGFPQFRARLSTAITGSGSALVTIVTSSAPDTSIVTVGIDPGTLTAGGGLTVEERPSVSGFDGTGTASTTVAQLPAHACRNVVIQNDPSSTTNLKVGFSTTPTIVVVPGSTYQAKVTNTNLMNILAASGTPTYNWSAGV